MGEVTEPRVVLLAAGPPLASDETLLHRLAVTGGFRDTGEDCPDAETEAGWPIFGQYVAHDLKADRSG